MSDDGWLSTKKVGRDDQRIARDKATAMQQRRPRPSSKKATSNNKTKKPVSKRKPKKSTKDDDSFIMDDDDEEEEDSWSEQEEDDDDEEEDVVLTEEEESSDDEFISDPESDDDDHVKPSSRKQKKSNSATSNSNSNSNSNSFLAKMARHQAQHKTAKQLENSKNHRKNAKNHRGGASALSSFAIHDDSSDDSDSDENGTFSKRPFLSKSKSKVKASSAVAPGKRKQAPHQKAGESSSDDDDDSELQVLSPSLGNKKQKPSTTSRFFAGNGTAASPMQLDDDDEDDDDLTPVRPSKKKKPLFSKTNNNTSKKKSTILDDDSSSEEDNADNIMPATKASSLSSPDYTGWSSGKSPAGKDNDAFDSDDDDDDEDRKKDPAASGSFKRIKKMKQKHNKANKSKTTKKTKKKAIISLDNSEEEPDAPIEMLDEESSSSSDEEDNGDAEDEFMDEDEREASNVLAAANELSAQVLRIMTTWASEFGQESSSVQNKQESNQDQEGATTQKELAIPQGMIVDGAIAMSSLTSSPESTHQNWITKETMKEILPGLELADYQLLGVNWLAMLHSMTCELMSDKNKKGNKSRTTNVNGILADEMGLGKTCQTIAFLAWLKDSRSKGAVKEVDVANVDKKGEALSDHDDDDEDSDTEVIHLDGATPSKNKHAQVSMRSRADDSAGDKCPHLVVVPASVVSNWEREFQKFAPGLDIIKFHGSVEERQNLKDILRQCRKKTRPMVDVILAPITYFQKESSEDRDFLRRFQFDYLICDEGHLLKNAKGLRYKNLDKFRTHHRLLLTGTPVQNSPQELMALLCFLMPLFKKRKSGFDDEGGDDGGASMLEHFVHLEGKGNEASDHELAYRKLKQLFAPFVLRRRKKDVLSQILPPKTYEVQFCELSPVARASYNSIVEGHLKAKRNKTKSATDHLFTTLRKAAHHPHLNRTRHTSPSELAHLQEWFHKYGAFRGEGCTKERVAQELEGFSDFDLHLTALELIDENPLKEDQLGRYRLTEDDLFASAKLKRLQEILPEMISNGHRILIFSMWTSCLDLLGCLLEQMALKYMRMDGQTATSDRQDQIDAFNSDDSIKVFLLSTTACGMGINLTSADVCIMHDISLNPFSDLQAEDRCHRIGQKKPVRIIKLVAKDTVDSDIYEMQERKVKMNAAIMESPSEWSKEEKKERNLIMKNIVQRHEQESSKPSKSHHFQSTNNQKAQTKKENVRNGEIIELL